MDRNILIGIFKQAAKDMAYERGLQLNTFGVIDNAPDLVHDSMGFNYDHHIAGEYWSRQWDGDGNDPNKNTALFPALFVEEGAMIQEGPDSPEYTQRWPVLIIDKIECIHCHHDEDRTPETVKANTKTILRRWLAEVSTFRKVEVNDGATATEQWVSEGRQAYLESLPGYTVGGIIEDLYSTMTSSPLTIEEVGGWDDYKAHRVVLEFSCCEATAGNFNYKEPTIDELAIIVKEC